MTHHIGPQPHLNNDDLSSAAKHRHYRNHTATIETTPPPHTRDDLNDDSMFQLGSRVTVCLRQLSLSIVNDES